MFAVEAPTRRSIKFETAANHKSRSARRAKPLPLAANMTRTEMVEAALRTGISLSRLEEHLDWLDMQKR